MTLVARDAVGNRGEVVLRPVAVVGLLGYLTNSTKVVYPQDLDRFSKTTTLSFRLSRPATVTWTLRNAAGQVLLTHLDAAPLRGRDPDLGLRRAIGRRGRCCRPASTTRRSAPRTARSRSPVDRGSR